MINSILCFSLMAAVTTALAAPAHAQTSIKSEEVKSCPGCSVRVTTVTRIIGSETAEHGIPVHPFHVARDSRGRVFASFLGVAPPMAFAPDGTVIRQLGRMGAGQGEFEMANRVFVLDGDSVLVLDSRANRLFAPDLHLARSTPGSMMMTFEIWMPGARRLWLEPAADGEVAFKLERSGKLESTVNVPWTPILRSAPPVLRLASAGGEDFWWGASNVYRLEKWGFDGKQRLTIERQPSWWAVDRSKPLPTDGAIGIGPDGTTSAPALKHPVSAINDIRDEAGFVWVISRVPRKLKPREQVARETAGSMRHPYDRYDTMVEVFDAASGKLVITQRINAYLSQLLPGGHAVKLTDNSAGAPGMEIVRLELVGVPHPL